MQLYLLEPFSASSKNIFEVAYKLDGKIQECNLEKLGFYYHLKLNYHDPYRLGNIRPKPLLLFSFNIQVIQRNTQFQII